MSVILFIMDGLGDRKKRNMNNAYNGTVLESANTPNFDTLASNGRTGLLSIHGKGIKPESEDAHLEIFGYNPKVYLKGRGPLEALGAGIKLLPDDLAFRTNFATVKIDGDKVILLDRRAGRIENRYSKRLGKKINGIVIDGVRFIFKQTVEHRGVLVLRPIIGRSWDKNTKNKNKGKASGMSLLSAKLRGNDPNHYRIREIKVFPSKKDHSSRFTAEIINKYLSKVYNILKDEEVNKILMKKGKLPANYLLLRGAGSYHRIPSMKKRFNINAVCVAGASLYKGIAKYVGMKVINVRGATGDKNTNLRSKIEYVERLARTGKYDLIFLHVKATDSYSHDKDCYGKMKFIEKIDRIIGSRLVKLSKNHDIIITGDHSTPCSIGEHTDDPVPLLIAGPGVTRPDNTRKFGEKWCKTGNLGIIMGKDVIQLIRKLRMLEHIKHS